MESVWSKSLFNYESETSATVSLEDSILHNLEQTKSNVYASDIKILISEGSDKKSTQRDGIQTGVSKENFFMRSFLNLLCLTISLENNSELLEGYLEKLERIGKFLLLSSESWSCTNINEYNLVQQKLSSSLGFIFTFMYKEMMIREGE